MDDELRETPGTDENARGPRATDGNPRKTPATDENARETRATDDELRCYCQLGGVMDLLSRKYAMQVLCVVNATDTTRFHELESVLTDASTSTLSARLDELGEAGLLTRTQYDEIPPRVEYDLTDEGRELAVRLEPVLEWIDDHGWLAERATPGE